VKMPRGRPKKVEGAEGEVKATGTFLNHICGLVDDSPRFIYGR
jgi:hypothetical protein